MSGATPALTGLLSRLVAYAVQWKFSFVPSDEEVYEPGIDREVADLDKANVISSELKYGSKGRNSETGKYDVPRHAVLLDIDYPAHLVESSTPGHYHLYLEVPGGVPHEKYMEVLKVLGEAGIIEKGYAEVSIARGHSDLRLPWVTKDDQDRSDNSGVEALAAADAAKRQAFLEHMRPADPLSLTDLVNLDVL